MLCCSTQRHSCKGSPFAFQQPSGLAQQTRAPQPKLLCDREKHQEFLVSKSRRCSSVNETSLQIANSLSFLEVKNGVIKILYFTFSGYLSFLNDILLRAGKEV
jgi:hypothetical protein